ncbi:Uu.00g135870.m01.CDS01 [Anthostomella pinea]|uniref:Uu.00g135870.m01.CDS01 n=1 Tax=Anthostomella pinea TaxID=933095 RepID=A0AAI8VQE2_9PEZI|nr:Uu.00g135870.m01.CDS01 [Anthostomella pinea]
MASTDGFEWDAMRTQQEQVDRVGGAAPDVKDQQICMRRLPPSTYPILTHPDPYSPNTAQPWITPDPATLTSSESPRLSSVSSTQVSASRSPWSLPCPLHTFLDFTFLGTLPVAQVRNGFAELIKISCCSHLQVFDWVITRPHLQLDNLHQSTAASRHKDNSTTCTRVLLPSICTRALLHLDLWSGRLAPAQLGFAPGADGCD